MLFPTARFRIISTWHLPGTPERIADILTRPEDFPRWWGDVYLSVKVLDRGDAQGVGGSVAVHSKGWLPYRLNWQGTLTAAHLPRTWRIRAEGDLEGEGVWSLTPEVGGTCVEYDWTVTSDRLLFRVLFPLLRGVMISNHNWAMAKGEAGLRRELVGRVGN